MKLTLLPDAKILASAKILKQTIHSKLKKMFFKFNYLTLMILITMLNLPINSYAGKLDLMAGYFNLEAEVGDQSGSVTTVGAYRVSYAQPLFSEKIDLELGYTLLMSNTFGGDLAYGIEAGVNFFPFTPSESYEGRSKNAALEIKPIWRPFVGTLFSQRQAQSTNSGYAGFGFLVGFERTIENYFDLKALVRYSLLSGPRSATANEMVVLLGITMPFNFGSK
jgi:hypothetical protein